MSDFYRELLYHPEIGRRTSSVSTELEREQVCKRYFWDKLHHTEYERLMSSAITELEKHQICKNFFFREKSITLSLTVVYLLQLLN